MADNVTQVTMWQDAAGYPWPTEAQAVLSNSIADLVAYFQGAIEAGSSYAQPIAAFSSADLQSLAQCILAGYTLTANGGNNANAAPAPSPAPAQAPVASPVASPAPAPVSH